MLRRFINRQQVAPKPFLLDGMEWLQCLIEWQAGQNRDTLGAEAPFRADQVELVAEDLRTLCWHPQAHVIANSFEAYLFSHAQALLPPFIGKVLLLSPIVGEFSQKGALIGFFPPRPDRRCPRRLNIDPGADF